MQQLEPIGYGNEQMSQVVVLVLLASLLISSIFSSMYLVRNGLRLGSILLFSLHIPKQPSYF